MALTQIEQGMLKDGILTADTAGRLKMADGFVNDAKISGVAASKISGQLADGNMSPGSVIQVVQAFKSDTSTIAASSYTDISGLSLSITPISSSSKILLMLHVQATQYQNTIQIRFVRNTTGIGVGDAVGSRVQSTVTAHNASMDNNHQQTAFAAFYLDSPATTSATTYKIQIKTQSGTTAYINRSANDADNSDWSTRPTSSITVMEIAQ